MAFQDLRSYLAELEKQGQLLRVTEKVRPEPDISAYLRAGCNLAYKGGPAIAFDNIEGYKGKTVVGNTQASWANIAISLGLDKNTSLYDQYKALNARWDDIQNGELVWVNDAPCQEVIYEKDINLYEILPLFKINKQDGGFYLSKACVISQDPDYPNDINKENVGCYRVQVQEPDVLGMQALPDHDLSLQLVRAEEENRPLPVAICLGNNPFVNSFAGTPLKYDECEYKLAAGCMGEPLQLTKCIGNNLDVPAWCEVVLEGEIIPRVRFPEGPFGEFAGTYSGVRQQIRIKVNRVTTRKDPIFENLYVGMPFTEMDTIAGITSSVVTGRQIWERMPQYIKGVNALQHHGMMFIIAADQRYGGFAKAVAYNAASCASGLSHGKIIIVIDGDKDPFDLTTVMWALTFRVRPGKDVIVINDDIGMPLDPCNDPPGLCGRLIIDATTPAHPDKMREVTMIDPINKVDDRVKEILAYLKNS